MKGKLSGTGSCSGFAGPNGADALPRLNADGVSEGDESCSGLGESITDPGAGFISGEVLLNIETNELRRDVNDESDAEKRKQRGREKKGMEIEEQ